MEPGAAHQGVVGLSSFVAEPWRHRRFLAFAGFEAVRNEPCSARTSHLMARRDDRIEHLLRRAGFAGSQDEVAELAQIGYQAAVDFLVFYEQAPDDIDARIGVPGHVGVTT